MNNSRFVDDLQSTITQRIRRARAAEKMSQSDVSERLAEYGLKIGPSAYAKLERGERRIEFAEALVLSKILHVSFADLVPETVRPEDEMRRTMARIGANSEAAADLLEEARATMRVVLDAIPALRQRAEQNESVSGKTLTSSYALNITLPAREDQLEKDMKKVAGASRRLQSIRHSQFMYEAERQEKEVGWAPFSEDDDRGDD